MWAGQSRAGHAWIKVSELLRVEPHGPPTLCRIRLSSEGVAGVALWPGMCVCVCVSFFMGGKALEECSSLRASCGLHGSGDQEVKKDGGTTIMP